MFWCLCTFTWYLGLPLAAVVCFGCLALLENLRGSIEVMNTPAMAAFFQASFAWCLIPYLMYIMQGTSDYPMLTAAVLVLIAGTVYTCYRTVLGDPGYLPLPALTEARNVVLGLAERDLLAHRNFCTSCLVRASSWLGSERRTRTEPARAYPPRARWKTPGPGGLCSSTSRCGPSTTGSRTAVWPASTTTVRGCTTSWASRTIACL